MSAQAWDELLHHRQIWGITGTAVEGGYVIPMNQPVNVLLAYLLDRTSPIWSVPATAQGAPTPGVPIPATGYTLKFRHNGVTYPATLKVKA